MPEAYEPVMDDGRGRFPEDLRVKTPRGARAAIAAALIKNTTQSEFSLFGGSRLLFGVASRRITLATAMLKERKGSSNRGIGSSLREPQNASRRTLTMGLALASAGPFALSEP
jgi:hypothetical protein